MKVFIKGKPNWAKFAVKDGKRVITERKAYGYARGSSYEILDSLAKEMVDREIAVPWKAGKHPQPKAEMLSEREAKKAAAKVAAKIKKTVAK